MKNPVQLIDAALFRNERAVSALRRGLILIGLALGLTSLAFSPQAQAVCQEGCAASNTFLGDNALISNTSGGNNTAVGADALKFNTSGFNNTATGDSALVFNATGSHNTANGVSALYSNSTGSENTAAGLFALFHNTTGSDNTATGANALTSNTTASDNTATGASALNSNTSGGAIRRAVLRRSLAIRQVSRTQRTGFKHYPATRPATTIRRPALFHS